MGIETISNGIKIFIYDLPNTHSVSISLYVMGGSIYETEENNGISHLIEHLHFRKAGEMSQNELFCKMESIGTTLRAITYKEYTRYYMKFRPQFIMEALDILVKIIQTYDWSISDIENEKKIVLDQIDEHNDYKSISEYTDELVYIYSYPVIGKKDTIKKINLSDIISYKKAMYVPENMYFVITGNLQDLDNELICKKLESVTFEPTFQIFSNSGFTNLKQNNNIMFVSSEDERIEVNLSFIIDYKQIPRECAILLNCIIGEGVGSKLQLIIREAKGLSSDISTFIEEHKDFGILNITFSTNKEMVYVVMENIVKVLNETKLSITDNEITTSLPFYTDNLYFLLDDPEELNTQIFDNIHIINCHNFCIQDEIQKFKNIRKEQLQIIAGKVFKQNNSVLVLMGDCRKLTKKKIKEILKKLS